MAVGAITCAAERKSLGDVIDAAVRTVGADITHKGCNKDVCRLRAFLRNISGLCQIAMALIGREHWEDWKNERLKEVVPATVRREMNLLMPILRKAADDLNMPVSFLDKVERPAEGDLQIVRLAPEWKEALFAEFTHARNEWLLPAARFALETGADVRNSI